MSDDDRKRCEHNWMFIRSEKHIGWEEFLFYCTRCLSVAQLSDTRWEYSIDEAEEIND